MRVSATCKQGDTGDDRMTWLSHLLQASFFDPFCRVEEAMAMAIRLEAIAIRFLEVFLLKSFVCDFFPTTGRSTRRITSQADPKGRWSTKGRAGEHALGAKLCSF